ncbi:ATP-dependent Clp protease adaptor ClpS [Myxococcota bacterium]|nr:ATP-dependent Clp protease adaptor ClpS [Myxococcota bacterium]MBU1430689.1 ATP-dependent Clp protease adaptor ClpS [Myxococcota bacterium]MBU1899487.1 ATP-dependent Clp protease adaptor ClpS [Myxococcota bacterium]
MSPKQNPGVDERGDVLTRQKVTRPPLYRVIFHNDDYTTQEFVIRVLMRYFHKARAEATQIMLQVHHQGRGIAGLYPRDIAASKVAQVEGLARENEMPLRLSIEPDGGGS